MEKFALKLLFSSEAKGAISTQLGGQHYSYRFIEEKFGKMLARHGLRHVRVGTPEAIKHPIALSQLCNDRDVIHIAFRSTENFRPIPGTWNICNFAWEFPVLSSGNLGHESPTQNQVRMLAMADEIWVCSRYAQRVLGEYGLENVVYMPIPIEMARGDRPLRLKRDVAIHQLRSVAAIPLDLSSGVGSSPMMEINYHSMGVLADYLPDDVFPQNRVFLLVCNPNDLRKNLLNVIDGFLLEAGPHDLLVVKLLVPNVDEFLLKALFDNLAPRFNGPVCWSSSKVVFVSEYISDSTLAALYSVSDFYLSASHTEGYNLPLVEAMAHGTVPISNASTAMADYITTHNAIVIPDAAYPGLIRGMAGDVAGITYSILMSDRFEIAKSVRKAQSLTGAEFNVKSIAAEQTVQRLLSEDAVWSIAKARFSELLTRPRLHEMERI
jgi:glycosyltransferase involved in cell wall biosynthesis